LDYHIQVLMGYNYRYDMRVVRSTYPEVAARAAICCGIVLQSAGSR